MSVNNKLSYRSL